MEISFPFQKEKSKLFGVIYRPVISFEIKSRTGWIPILAYLDSGADVTILPRSFIDLLGVRFKEEDIKIIGGIGGGRVPVVVKEAKLKIGSKIIQSKVAIALIQDIPYLLGREGVFEYFKICFRQKKKVTRLEEENRK